VSSTKAVFVDTKSDPKWWYLIEPESTHALQCRTYMPRGKPETCNTVTTLLIGPGGSDDNLVPVCREHVEAAYAAYMLLHGQVELMHFGRVMVSKWGLTQVAPDALPEPDEDTEQREADA
jgi:hypothetical protein